MVGVVTDTCVSISSTLSLAELTLIRRRRCGPRDYKINMAQRQRQRLLALRNDPNLARFVVEGIATGKQLGTGSYGAVEEVRNHRD